MGNRAFSLVPKDKGLLWWWQAASAGMSEHSVGSRMSSTGGGAPLTLARGVLVHSRADGSGAFVLLH